MYEAKEAAAGAPGKLKVALLKVYEMLKSEDWKEDWNERHKIMKQLYSECSAIPEAIYKQEDSPALSGFKKPELPMPRESDASSPSSASSRSTSSSPPTASYQQEDSPALSQRRVRQLRAAEGRSPAPQEDRLKSPEAVERRRAGVTSF